MKHVNILAVLLSAVCSLVAPASAEANIPYCDPTEKYAPHGIVLKMADAYYRACRPRGGGGDLPWHQFLLRINPASVPELLARFTSSDIRVMERVDGSDRLKSAFPLNPIEGTRIFGGVPYESHEYVNKKSGDMPAGGVYIYRPSENDDIPFHWVSCSGWELVKEGRSLSCYVYLRNDDIVASLRFAGNKERGTAFVDHFAAFAKDIERVIEAADVTDRLDEMKTFLDIVE